MSNEKKDNKKTSNLEEDVREMNDKQMYNLLIDLVDTEHWKAVKRFFDKRALEAEQSLYSIDPFKDPTVMARNQGIRMGSYALESYIMQVLEDRKKKEKQEQENKNDEEDEYNPGYNNF